MLRHLIFFIWGKSTVDHLLSSWFIGYFTLTSHQLINAYKREQTRTHETDHDRSYFHLLMMNSRTSCLCCSSCFSFVSLSSAIPMQALPRRLLILLLLSLFSALVEPLSRYAERVDDYSHLKMHSINFDMISTENESFEIFKSYSF